MREDNWFDAEYFGHAPNMGGEPKSNYGRLTGGYHSGLAAPVQFVDWIIDQLGSTEITVDDDEGESTRPLRILEIGCAFGDAVAEMRRRGLEAYGIDVSPYALENIVQNAVDFVGYGSMTDIESSELVIQNQPFDAVVSKDVLEHATPNLINKILISFGAIAPKQLHVVNTGEHDYQAAGGDQSHFCIKPLSWWNQRAKKLKLDVIFKET